LAILSRWGRVVSFAGSPPSEFGRKTRKIMSRGGFVSVNIPLRIGSLPRGQRGKERGRGEKRRAEEEIRGGGEGGEGEGKEGEGRGRRGRGREGGGG